VGQCRPVAHTFVDHGIAEKGIAAEHSLVEALRQAAALSMWQDRVQAMQSAAVG
jgi:4-hydroxy-L-threonine phosphate dehydrogenase PdxA